MQIEYVHYTNQFERQYRKLSSSIQEVAEEKENIFRKDAFDARLRTHKLHGNEAPARAFWINQSYRVKFVFLPNGGALFLEVGTHDIYK